jgi:hypothetical protein
LYSYYGLPDSLVGLIEADAVRAGERARMLLALEEDDQEKRRSVRRRLATTLVQLGVRLDPAAADELAEDVA